MAIARVDPGEIGSLRVAPSILSANFTTLGADIAMVEPAVSWLHVDVMDGHFVPNLTIGPPVVQALRATTSLYLDCHLMMTNPGQYLEAFRDAGADGCTVHVEVGGTNELIDQMRNLGLRVGLAVNPDGTFGDVEPYLDRIDLLLCMTVFPGFGGQSFLPAGLEIARQASAAASANGWELDIEVDGGVDVTTVVACTEAGANIFVAGSAVFNRPDPAGAAIAIVESARVARAAIEV
ncbi:MAG: ribulose-phosphate 3-epimerase [Actinomycetota bacterium]